ncbi:MAG: prolipoprotein diacylglyceryl transferase, partial [Pseudomonadota bacterium]|nr:prolipoprotein diacylglyceryl transferase [Pseudomonadota bacterium]
VLSLPLIAVGLFLLWLARRSPTVQPDPCLPAAG